jgi:hypothetical protein
MTDPAKTEVELPEMPKTKPRRERHGLTETPEWRSWRNMITQCECPNIACYPRYGGRGISVCERWRYSFTTFLQDMGPRPPGMSLDRVDPNSNYDPDNCRWANATEQTRNTRGRKDNASGVAGVYWSKVRKKWHVRIAVSGKQIDLGYATTTNAAAEIRREGERKYWSAQKDPT